MSQKKPLVLYGSDVGEISPSDQFYPDNLGTGVRDGTKFLRDDGVWSGVSSGGGGSVTDVSVVTANGISGIVANSTTLPAITLTLGDITPSSIVTGAFSSTVNLSFPAVTVVQTGSGFALDVTGISTFSDSILIGTDIDNGVDALQVDGSANFTGIVRLDGGVEYLHTAIYNGSNAVTTTSTTNIDTFSASTFRSAKYQIQISDGTSFETLELAVLHNGTTVYLTSYGHLFNSPASLGHFDAALVATNITITFTAVTATSKTIKFLRSAVTI